MHQHKQKQKIRDSYKLPSVCLNSRVRPLPPQPRSDHTVSLVCTAILRRAGHPPERGTTVLPEAGDGHCGPDNGRGA